MAVALPVLCVQLLLAITGARAQTWDWTNQNEWPVLFENDCAGKRQSPIDLSSDAEVDCTLPPFVGIDRDWEDHRLQAENNGKTMSMKIPPGEGAPLVSGGGLPFESYDLREIHFHWCSRNDVGSEHTVDGKSYPMEAHLVHVRTGMTLSEALTTDGAIAVLGVFLDISTTVNEVLEELNEPVGKVEQPGSAVDLETVLHPYRLLPPNIDRFYRYKGSLTTPTCNEVVVWTVFSQIVPVTQQELETFRKVQIVGSSFNFRELQPINGRPVTQRWPKLCALCKTIIV